MREGGHARLRCVSHRIRLLPLQARPSGPEWVGAAVTVAALFFGSGAGGATRSTLCIGSALFARALSVKRREKAPPFHANSHPFMESGKIMMQAADLLRLQPTGWARKVETPAKENKKNTTHPAAVVGARRGGHGRGCGCPAGRPSECTGQSLGLVSPHALSEGGHG